MEVTLPEGQVSSRGSRTPMDLLLGDFDRAEFFDRYWEKRSFVIHHRDPGRFAHLLTTDQFMDEEVYYCKRLRAAYLDSKGWPAEVLIQPTQARQVFAQGLTVGASMMREQGVLKDFLDAFRKDVYSAGIPHFNCYYSPDQKGYSVHFDAHPVWFLQIDGSKHWYIGREPVVKNPQFTCGFPPDREVLKLPWVTVEKPRVEDPEQFMSVTLEPGDVVYMPPGTWHRACAQGYSLALTLAASRASIVDMLFLLLRQSLATPEFREIDERVGGVYAPRANGNLPDDTAEGLARRLAAFQRLVERIEVADLRRAYAHMSRMSNDALQMSDPKLVVKMMRNMQQG